MAKQDKNLCNPIGFLQPCSHFGTQSKQSQPFIGRPASHNQTRCARRSRSALDPSQARFSHRLLQVLEEYEVTVVCCQALLLREGHGWPGGRAGGAAERSETGGSD